jgi:hypothetical protein
VEVGKLHVARSGTHELDHHTQREKISQAATLFKDQVLSESEPPLPKEDEFFDLLNLLFSNEKSKMGSHSQQEFLLSLRQNTKPGAWGMEKRKKETPGKRVGTVFL